jgi:uncharacterized protein (UPF0548 family)
MLVFARPRPAQVEAWLARLQQSALTYPEVGATSGPDLPAGYHAARAQADLGTGDEVWERAKLGISTWQAQKHAGATVYPQDASPVTGTTVVLVFKAPLLSVVVPCRVVYQVDEAERFGFGYGTLPGHPEIGEEAFIVSRQGDGPARFEVTAFSRPGDLSARLGGPLPRLAQSRATRAYLEGIKRFVASPQV